METIVLVEKVLFSVVAHWLRHWDFLSVFSRVQLFATPWTVTCQAPLSMGFSKQEYWSRLPFCPPGDLPDPGIEPASLMSPAWLAGSLSIAPPGKPRFN